MVDIEGCRQVKKCQKCQVAGFQCKEDVGHNFEHGGFSGMVVVVVAVAFIQSGGHKTK